MYGIAPPGFRLPDDTYVGAVRLQVSDLNRSLDYYEHVLGLRVQNRTGDEAALGAADDQPTLIWLRARAGIAPVPPRGAFGLYHFAILLPDRAAVGRFAAHLSRFELRVGSADHRVSESLYLWDPDGLGIEVYADRPRSSWQHNGRELVITTELLDVSNLVAAGGGHEWYGMPARTTLGHMHLHVGRLDVAEAFYHRGLGFDKTAWSYPGAFFFSAGGYHHHLGTNTWSPGPAAAPDQAQLLEWELVVPSGDDALHAASSLRAAGFVADEHAESCTVADPWGTHLRIVTAQRR